MGRVKKNKNKKKPIKAGSTYTKETGGIMTAKVAAISSIIKEQRKTKVDG